MDLLLRSVTDSLFNGPVVNVDIFEDSGLLGKNDPVNARVYDYPFAEQAGKRSRDQLSGFHFDANQIQVGPDHVETGGMDYSVHLGVNRPAKLVVLAGRDVFCLAIAISQVDAVGRLAWRTVIAGAYYLIVFHDYGAKSAPQTGAPHCDRSCDVHIILALRRSFHFSPMRYQMINGATLFRPPAAQNSIRK
jgi:hypothetical protein